jgi:hypothetical protein
MAQVGRHLVDHFSLRVTDDVYGVNTPYAAYGIGVSLATLPLYVIQKTVGAHGPGHQFWVLLVNPILLAATAVVLFRVGRALAWSRRRALAVAVVFGVLTTAPWQSTELFSEPGVTLGLGLALLGLIRFRAALASGPRLLGAGLALATLFRTDSALLGGVVLLTLPAFVPSSRLKRWRTWVPQVGVPLVVVGGWIAFYNRLRTGSPFRDYQNGGFTASLWTGLHGLVYAPGKGFWWYNPVLLLAVPGLVVLWRRDRAVALAIAVLVVVRPLFYAKWDAWPGGTCWGPRFLFPLCALLAIPAVEAIASLRAGGGARLAAGVALAGTLSLASLALTVLSVWVPYERFWIDTTVARGVPPARAHAVIYKQEWDSYWAVRGSQIWGNARLLDHAVPFPLARFRGGLTPGGSAALVLGAAALGLAVVSCADGRMPLAQSARS